MTKPLKSLLPVVAVSLCTAMAAPVALGAEACPNEQLRAENNSLNLPDCRAYELVSTDLNHASLTGPVGADASGDTTVYQTRDAPDDAPSAVALATIVRSQRNAASGWHGVSMAPPLAGPVIAFGSFYTPWISRDLSTVVEESDGPVSGGPVPSGRNVFISRPDGTYQLVTNVGSPFHPGTNSYVGNTISGGTPNGSTIYLQPNLPQFPADPPGSNDLYAWSADRGLRLVSILPGDIPAPNGVRFVGNSDDGHQVVFEAEGSLYVRVDDERTMKVGELSFNGGKPSISDQAIVPGDSGTVLFTSRTRQTADANPAGKDLYSYDVASDSLTDLTIDSNPADAATGAEVRHVLRVTADGSYIYFAADGDLAEGATPGHTSLYLWHNGTVQFVARADGLFNEVGVARETYMAPDGHTLAFDSTDSLTGYDNTDPITGSAHDEVFVASLGSNVRCASCRADGQRPTGDSTIPPGGSQGEPARAVSDSGARVFFDSTDAIIPGTPSGTQQVYEYSDGKASAISHPGGAQAGFLDASASGDDVFFESYDSQLVQSPNAGDEAVFDARVGGGFPVVLRHECSGSDCHGTPVGPPVVQAPGSSSFSGAGNLASPGAAPQSPPANTAVQTRSQKLAKALKTCRKKPRKQRPKCEKQARKHYGRTK